MSLNAHPEAPAVGRSWCFSQSHFCKARNREVRRLIDCFPANARESPSRVHTEGNLLHSFYIKPAFSFMLSLTANYCICSRGKQFSDKRYRRSFLAPQRTPTACRRRRSPAPRCVARRSAGRRLPLTWRRPLTLRQGRPPTGPPTAPLPGAWQRRRAGTG